MEYNTAELDKLVTNWIKFRYAMEKAKTHNEEDAVEEDYNMELVDFCLIKYLPKLTFSIILNILEKDSSDIVMKVLAAGELEDLLSEHGELIIEDIETEAKKNSNFKKLLGGVWQADMSNNIFQRVINAAGGEDKRW